MNLNERISKIIEYTKLSSSEFADEIEVQRSSISHITSGRNKPSLEFISKVKSRYPEIEWEWIITGEGEMLKKPEEETATEPKAQTSSLPDLFSLIADDNFGKNETEEKIEIEKPRESVKTEPVSGKAIVDDSQRLENIIPETQPQTTVNQENKIKRIVLFYENGKFESFEP